MGSIGLILIGIVGLVLWVIYKLLKWILVSIKKQYDHFHITRNQRSSRSIENVPCSFSDGISRQEFLEIVGSECKTISNKRLKNVSANSSTIYATVRSQSGLSDWNFSLDFNDYGHLTGRYWVHSENSDSSIPMTLGNRIAEEIQKTKSGRV